MKSFRARKEDVVRRWIQLDATDQVLGKVAVKAADILMGKEKPTFTPGVDTGDFVVVTNARHVKATGRKEERKIYRRHSEWVGSMVEEPLGAVRSKKPEKLIQLAVRRMLPKNTMGVHMLKRLKVYPGTDHPHAAQSPARVDVPGKGGWLPQRKPAPVAAVPASPPKERK
jgi:large subunit ribosomal protein L13